MMNVIAILLAASGMIVLALAMSRHHRDLFGSSPPPGRRLALRLAAGGLLTLNGIINILLHGWGIGLVLAMTEIMAAGVVVGLALGWAMDRRSTKANAAS